ncbi:DUF2231 domain-containing protein [Solitalea lacus]|uniref:DUF2231 domain-containing protein n=1 Tax=Solitalea lacus TaxID=2911172 RepID=UPI001EDC478C|nr:DUF2231 domain-containing protein [Solitalea lacus]UKJ06703.1 hypothetical protein L2B55_14340 [Solitalea lacus]
MNQAHWHLVLNHFPIVGTFFSILLLFAGIVLKNPGLKRSGLVLFVLTGILAIPAFLTGEGAEEVLKNKRLTDENLVEQHEELGEIAMWTFGITGLLALVTLILDIKQKAAAKYFALLTLIISLANGVLLKNVGTSGGEIRHIEIRTNRPDTTIHSKQNQKQETGQGKDED